MAANYIQSGDVIEVAAPEDKVSGAGCLVGGLFGVCVTDVDSGDMVQIKTTGVWQLTKVGSQAWVVGAAIYWDNGNDRCTTVDTGFPIGYAVAAVASGAGDTLGIVRLNGFIPSALFST